MCSQHNNENEKSTKHPFNSLGQTPSQEHLGISTKISPAGLGSINETFSSAFAKSSLNPKFHISDTLLNFSSSIQNSMNQSVSAALKNLALVTFETTVSRQEMAKSLELLTQSLNIPMPNYESALKSLSVTLSNHIIEGNDIMLKSIKQSIAASLENLGHISIKSTISMQEIIESLEILGKNIDITVPKFETILESTPDFSYEYTLEQQATPDILNETLQTSTEENREAFQAHSLPSDKSLLIVQIFIFLQLWIILITNMQVSISSPNVDETNFESLPNVTFEDIESTLKNVFQIWVTLNDFVSDQPLTLTLFGILLRYISLVRNNNRNIELKNNKDIIRMIDKISDGNLDGIQKERLYNLMRHKFNYSNKRNVLVKNLPETKSLTKGVLDKKQTIIWMDKKDKWCKVMYCDENEIYDGWILSKYLKKIA